MDGSFAPKIEVKPKHENLRSPEEPRKSEKLLTLIKKHEALGLMPEEDLQELREQYEHSKRMEDLAATDELTGLPNKREFLSNLKWFQKLNERHDGDGEGKGYSVVAFDLDGFKAVNDTFGHAGGDECLKLIAQEVRAVLRDSDIFAREGGDEFVVLLPETDRVGAAEAAEKILATINERVSDRLRMLYPTTKGVSASIGTVSYHKEATPDVEQEDVLKLADYVRYVVKAAGKKGAITLEEAREIDSENKLWEAFVEGVPLPR